MIFLSANITNTTHVNKIFTTMEKTVGLKINQTKSQVFFSVGITCKTEITTILQMPEHDLPVKYLGVPFSVEYIHATHCLPPLHRISANLEGWDCNLLTTAGRAELIHSTITPIVMYWVLIYNLPQSMLNKVDKLCIDFFWKGKLHKILFLGRHYANPKLKVGLVYADLQI